MAARSVFSNPDRPIPFVLPAGPAVEHPELPVPPGIPTSPVPTVLHPRKSAPDKYATRRLPTGPLTLQFDLSSICQILPLLSQHRDPTLQPFPIHTKPGADSGTL